MILFQNDGLLDINALTTLGVSVKSDSAIGYFGTGLKFAVATLLRTGHTVTIIAGRETYVFWAKEKAIQGRNFNVVMMNDQALGFTTELGRNWQPWMAFRELYSNTLDEQGHVARVECHPLPFDRKTSVIMEGELIESEYDNRGRYFIETEPLFKVGNVEFHQGANDGIFYRGVRVSEAYGRQTAYTYNVLEHVELTEDRTAKYPFMLAHYIQRAVKKLESKEMIREIITRNREETHYEHNLSFEHQPGQHSEAFEEVVTREYRKNSLAVNKSLHKFVASLKPADLYVPSELNDIQRHQLERAKMFVERVGYPEVNEYKLTVVQTLGPSVYAKVLKETDEIIMSKRCFDEGTKFVASTLLEEVIHIREGLLDETRAMQTYLFDRIITLGEELIGEAA